MATALAAVLLAGAFLAAPGCDKPIARPPVTVAQYEKKLDRRGAYPPVVVARHNIRRVLDDDVPIEQRQRSLELVMHLQTKGSHSKETLAALWGNPNVPPQLQQDLREYLLQRDDPALTGFVLEALRQPKIDQTTTDAMMRWLARNGDAGAFAELVKVWSLEPPTGPNEKLFRSTAARIRQTTWDQALLDAQNTPTFRARGSLQEVLVQRVPMGELKKRFLAASARSDAVAAIQAFIRTFDYVPISRGALIQAVYVHKTQRRSLQRPLDLYERWRTDATRPYDFNVRDFPLMSALAGNAEAMETSRSTLLLRLARARIGRRHAIYRAARRHAGRINTRLSRQSGMLSMADVWNIWLIEELLSRPKIRTSLKELAKRDRADTRVPSGGLIVYEGRRAEAKLYPADPAAGDDLKYVPDKPMLRAARRALCRFVAHFEKVDNAERTGPTVEELQDAKINNYYGLTFTTLDEDTFSAHYYTPTGIVISLGKFPFGAGDER